MMNRQNTDALFLLTELELQKNGAIFINKGAHYINMTTQVTVNI